ncbi:hypothetical protein Pint_12083 [Pistacia integerrima]|uniref:Uncharacterized protein n=1 Tax=Pistacia integerrima TaxID=434235 RepID=A0ACC0XMP7_9ROSI|nr:hypothetical protein Pint_12083 [Pistacia integerrima]
MEEPKVVPLSTSTTEAPKDRPVRVYADGIYDLFHFGHAGALEQAKKLLRDHDPMVDKAGVMFPDIYLPLPLVAYSWSRTIPEVIVPVVFPNTYLLVGCNNDEDTHKYKGKTVMTDEERYESLRHCRWVDEVIPDAPWVVTQEFLDKHQIDYVAHDSLPYVDASGAGKDVYEFVSFERWLNCVIICFYIQCTIVVVFDDGGGGGGGGGDGGYWVTGLVKSVGKFKETKRTDGISTSDIIMRIVKDYNQYVMRNLDRGYTRKDLGVSYVKEKRLRMNIGLKKLQEKVKKQQEKVGEKIQIVVKTAGMHRNEWVENADRLVAGFLEMFEERFHKMGTAIRDRIQERLRGQQLIGFICDRDDEDDAYYYNDSDEEEEKL